MMSFNPNFSATLRGSGIALAWAIWFAAGWLSAAEPGEPVTITVKRVSNISTKTATLGNIADINGGNKLVRDRLVKLDIADVPTNGGIVRVSRQQIGFRLRLADVAAHSFDLEGADEVIVAFRPSTVSSEQVSMAAREALARLLPDADQVNVRLIQPVGLPFVIQAEPADVTIKAQPHDAGPLAGRVQMDTTISVRGEKKCTVPAFFEIKPIAASRDEGVTMVRARQSVKMVVRLGPINVLAMGEALQDGKSGQTIRIKNSASNKIVSGRVVGPSLVEVDTGGSP